MTTITLPPLPEPDEMAFESWMDSNGYLNSVLARRAWNAGILHIHTQLRARDLEVARVVLEGAAKNCDDAAIRLFSGKSRVNQVDRHVAEVLRDKAKAIRNLEVKHHE